MKPLSTSLSEPPESFILVVDDIAKNIQVVGSILAEAGYEVMPATSGAQALERVRGKVPDLILLDLMMPEMDGLEVCRCLKADPCSASVPVIFLTSSNELQYLVEAFTIGAVDYVTKPFNAAELLARVRTHLELKQTRDTLVRQSQRLREMNDEKNEFLGIAAHDLRNPLHNIIASANFLLEDTALAPGEVREMAEIINQSAEHMLRLVVQLLDVNAIERGELKLDPAPHSLADLVGSALDSHRRKAAAKQQTVHFTPPSEPATVCVDAHATIEVVDNLLSNAIKYSPLGRQIHVRVAVPNGSVRLEVQDEGPGLTEADQRRLFTKFARLSAKPTGGELTTGLGLSIVKKMVEASQGRVWCESQPGQGATFIVEWPKAA